MIVRCWRGRAARSRASDYPAHFARSVLPELQAIEGFRGATLLRREDGAEIEFLVLTRWASLETVHAFAGDDIERAVVEPEAMAALVCFDDRVQHYEVVHDEKGKE